MQPLELLFAMQLRNLAADLRSSARANYYAGIFGQFVEDERKAKLTAWELENPISRFIPAALEEVEQVAEHVQALRRTDNHTAGD